MRWSRGIASGLCLALSVGSAVAQRSSAPRYIVFDGLQYSAAQLELAARSPVPATPPGYSYDAIRLTRSRDGHYYLHGSVNGFPIVFLVDTGATVTAIPPQMARNAGLRVGLAATVGTAAGKSEVAVTKDNELLLGSIKLTGMTVSIAPGSTQPLLGMDALRLFSIAQESDTLLLRLNP